MALTDTRVEATGSDSPALQRLVSAFDDAQISVECVTKWGFLSSDDTDHHADCTVIILDPVDADRLTDLLKDLKP